MGIKFWGCTTYLFQSFWLYKIFEKDLCFAIELLQGRNYYIIAPRPAYHLGKNKNNSLQISTFLLVMHPLSLVRAIR